LIRKFVRCAPSFASRISSPRRLRIISISL
jgi:hypothetical protein